MNSVALPDMTTAGLVKRFEDVCLSQDVAILNDDNEEFTRLFREMVAIEDELRSRDGDERRALAALFEHRNAQVRLNAAKATLALLPQEARRVIEALAHSHEFPQAGYAGMTLVSLERGIFKPT